MQISQKYRNMIATLEGDKAHEYADSNGLPTIAIGHCLTQSELHSGKIEIKGQFVVWRNGLTLQQIEDLLDQDLEPAEAAVKAYISVALTQGQYDCLTDFAFNSGAGSLKGSTLRRVLNDGYYGQVTDQLRRWIHARDGSVCKGLVNRRNAEIALWLGIA